MDSDNSIIKDIKAYAESMKLSVIKGDIDVAIEDANASNLSYEEFLCGLLQKECDIRNYNLLKAEWELPVFLIKNL